MGRLWSRKKGYNFPDPRLLRVKAIVKVLGGGGGGGGELHFFQNVKPRVLDSLGNVPLAGKCTRYPESSNSINYFALGMRTRHADFLTFRSCFMTGLACYSHPPLSLSMLQNILKADIL